MLKIALTGGIACGKSLVGQYLVRDQVPVCDTDDIGHDILDRNPTVREGVIREFGTCITRPDGTIDRTVLGRIVFAHDDKRARLNALTHPAILKQATDWVDAQRPAHPEAVVIIPLLFETGLEKDWDKVICVAAPEGDQLRRLAERGLAEADARARINAQMSLATKMEQSDFVIYNCGSIELLEEQVKQVWRTIRGA